MHGKRGFETERVTTPYSLCELTVCALPQVADHAGTSSICRTRSRRLRLLLDHLDAAGAAAALVEWLQALHFSGCALLAAITGVELKGLKLLAQFFTIIAARWDSAKRLREREETDRAAGWWRFSKPRPRRGLPDGPGGGGAALAGVPGGACKTIYLWACK